MSVWLLVALFGFMLLGAGAAVAIFLFSKNKAKNVRAEPDDPLDAPAPAPATAAEAVPQPRRTLVPDEPSAQEPPPPAEVAPPPVKVAPPPAEVAPSEGPVTPPPAEVAPSEVPVTPPPALLERDAVVPSHAGDAPAPAVAAPPSPVAEPAVPASAPGDPVVVFEPLEKIRIADLGIVVRASRASLGGDDCFVLTTEGLEGRGGKELAFYAPYVAEIDVVRSLKRFAGLAIRLAERGAPAAVWEILRFPGEVGTHLFAGYLVAPAHEPAAVPLPEHFVLLGLGRGDVSHDASALRTALHARAGGHPWLSRGEG